MPNDAQASHPFSDGSKKAYYREFKKVVDAADVVLEVLDARDPLGCRCLQVEEAVLTAGSRKRLVLVLNKIDLVPAGNVEVWLKHLRNEFPTVAFKASTQSQRQHLVPLGACLYLLSCTFRFLVAEQSVRVFGSRVAPGQQTMPWS
eukprot:m.89450 g.89450  ORF g.89450 m.89450 type:complete len:146 (+) comp36607_c0_seq36:937-1374(+)